MKTTDFISLEKQVLQYLPNFSIKGRLMLMPPVRPILRGIALEGSSFDKESFSVTAFILPMFVPSHHLYLNFGHRVRHAGGGDRWNIKTPTLLLELGTALRLQAVPFLSRVTSLADFIETARGFSQDHPTTLRAIAYSLARAGRTKEATKALDRLLEHLDPRVDWQRKLADEADLLRRTMVENTTDVQRLLVSWETETERNLGLENM